MTQFRGSLDPEKAKVVANRIKSKNNIISQIMPSNGINKNRDVSNTDIKK
jgi:hypothetical protein